MKNKTTKLTPLALLLALGATSVNAQPVPFGGHFYEVIIAPGISWDAAKAEAEDLAVNNFNGAQGHLATITSFDEDEFINQLREDAIEPNPPEVWVGGFQDLPCSEGVEPTCGWTWVNGEGVFPGVSSASPYANWLGGEPNDNTGSGSENHLAVGLGNAQAWNDEGALGNIGGYIVEYDGTVDASTCVTPMGEDPQFCNPSGVVPTNLDEIGELPPDSTITGALLEPTVPDVVCTGPNTYRDLRVDETTGRAIVAVPLDVFEVHGGGVPGTLILDEFTYGSPCFAVMEGSASFSFTEGVVRNEQLPDEVSGIGNVFGCFNTDALSPDFQPDLQLVSEFAYQTSDKGEMIEGGAAAMTGGCNSPSRAGTFRFSFHVLNTHEDCGIDFLALGGPKAVLQCFRDLGNAKFAALAKSIRNAKSSLTSRRTFRRLSFRAFLGRLTFVFGLYDHSLAQLAKLNMLVENAEFTGDFNHQGNLIMRTENLIYRVTNIRDANNAL